MARLWSVQTSIVDNNAGGLELQLELQVVGKDPSSVPEAGNGLATTAVDLREEVTVSKLITFEVFEK